MTAPLPPAGTRTVQPSDDAPPPFQARPAAKLSQSLADQAADGVRRIDAELADLATREEQLLAERFKLVRMMKGAGSTQEEER